MRDRSPEKGLPAAYPVGWNTTAQSNPESQGRVLEVDPQLARYSYATQAQRVFSLSFARKKQPEIQYLRGGISKRSEEPLYKRRTCWQTRWKPGH
jgi:hypothetical protein